MTTATDTPEVVTLSRPEGMKDARWERVNVEADLLATGHYTWCDDHQNADDEYGGYCYRRQSNPFGNVDMSNGSHDGGILIAVDCGTQSLTELQHQHRLVRRRAPQQARLLGGTDGPMTRRLRSVLLAVQDTAHDIRPEGFVRLGPVYFTTFQRHFDAVKNGFDMGRDYERGQIKRLAGRVDRCEALLRELEHRDQPPRTLTLVP